MSVHLVFMEGAVEESLKVCALRGSEKYICQIFVCLVEGTLGGGVLPSLSLFLSGFFDRQRENLLNSPNEE